MQRLLSHGTATQSAFLLQAAIVVTVSNAWGQPVSAKSVTLEVSPRDAATKGKHSKQQLQAGSAAGEYLYDVATSSLKPGSYL